MSELKQLCAHVRFHGWIGLLALALLASIAPGLRAQDRWTEEQANAWYARQPWPVGANFLPSTAINELNRLGLAYLHIVEPIAGDPVPAGEIPDIGFFRKIWRGPLIGNKGYDLARANAAIRDGAADLISFAALFIANPDLPERIRQGLPLTRYDRSTFYGGDARGYTDYPVAETAAAA